MPKHSVLAFTRTVTWLTLAETRCRRRTAEAIQSALNRSVAASLAELLSWSGHYAHWLGGHTPAHPPARHGRSHADHGPVIGFVLDREGEEASISPATRCGTKAWPRWWRASGCGPRLFLDPAGNPDRDLAGLACVPPGCHRVRATFIPAGVPPMILPRVCAPRALIAILLRQADGGWKIRCDLGLPGT
jgi:hypothetical protein